MRSESPEPGRGSVAAAGRADGDHGGRQVTERLVADDLPSPEDATAFLDDGAAVTGGQRARDRRVDEDPDAASRGHLAQPSELAEPGPETAPAEDP